MHYLSLLSGGMDLTGLFAFIAYIMFGIPLITLIAGSIAYFKEKKKTAKIFFIIGGLYLLIGLGICGGLMNR